MRYGYKDVKWPAWKKVTDRWLGHAVRDVTVRKFRLEEDHPEFPWFDVQAERQYFGSSNPQDGTAYHLCCALTKYSADLQIAYKLYAFCRAEEISSAHRVLAPVFEKERSHLSHWWNGNAVHVLPPLKYDWHNRERYSANRDDKWTSVVDKAAAAWGLVAEQWAIIRIPDWMDRDDPDLEKYWKAVHSLSEARERAEYERLKKKFESQPARQ